MAFKASVTVLDQIGLHARPAAQIAKVVKETGFDVQLVNLAGDSISAASPLRMMAMKARPGDILEVVVEGASDTQASELVAQIQEFLQG
jgi:phosphotransferase system HPr (HPr) family protein